MMMRSQCFVIVDSLDVCVRLGDEPITEKVGQRPVIGSGVSFLVDLGEDVALRRS